MTEMILATTFRLLKQHGACSDRYAHLAKALGGVRKYGADTPIPLWRILETNGRDDTYWAFQAVPENQVAWRDRIARLHACDCVCSTPLADGRVVYDLLKDERSRQAVATAEAYALGLVPASRLDAAQAAAGAAAGDAARDAAQAAAGDAARDVAWDAARAAAGDVAWDAARDVAGDVAWDAARDVAWDAAGAAARDVAWAAAGAAARDVAWPAAGAAARAAAREWQTANLRLWLGGSR
jgi:hypothetical protein